MFRNSLFALALAGVFAAGAPAQQQERREPATVRDICVKTVPGKTVEFDAFLNQYVIPLNRSRLKDGDFDWFALARPVIVASTSPQCDYRVVYGYQGFPPEPPGPAQLDAALKRAGLNMSGRDWMARRDTLSSMVGQDLWWGIDSIGPPMAANSYVQLNHYKVKSGRFDDWVKLETGYWKKFVAEHLEHGGKASWAVLSLAMPQGDSLPYNAMTVDIFPDWNSLIHGWPVGELWPKVHPDISAERFLQQLDGVRERHSVDVYKIVEVVRGTAANASR